MRNRKSFHFIKTNKKKLNNNKHGFSQKEKPRIQHFIVLVSNYLVIPRLIEKSCTSGDSMRLKNNLIFLLVFVVLFCLFNSIFKLDFSYMIFYCFYHVLNLEGTKCTVFFLYKRILDWNNHKVDWYNHKIDWSNPSSIHWTHV